MPSPPRTSHVRPWVRGWPAAGQRETLRRPRRRVLHSIAQSNRVTGPQGERAAERRGQAHQPLEPDLGKPRGAIPTVCGRCAGVAEDERRECGRRTATTVVPLWFRVVVFVRQRFLAYETTRRSLRGVTLGL